MKKSTWIILGIVVVVILWFWFGYNGLVTKNEAIDGQWAQVETAYQRRFDLIPSLVNSVKGIMSQEQEIFNNLAEARSNYAGATSIQDKVAAANQVETTFGRLLAIMENYPQLRSVETVQTLMVQLEGTENRINTERGRFNDFTRVYNVAIKRFPGSILASIFGFDERSYFDAEEGAEEAPVVEL